MTLDSFARVRLFCEDFGLRIPILMAPMAGACPPALAAAVANGGGMGACGALMMEPEAIEKWARNVRAQSNGAFQFNLWVPDSDPPRVPRHEEEVTAFMAQWGPEVPHHTLEQNDLPEFDAQFEAILASGPAVVSSIMGLFSPKSVSRLKEKRVKWLATVTTVSEARAAQSAGADIIVAQGVEAGGHRGGFDAQAKTPGQVGLFSLLPAVVDAVDVPVVATGGIADARGIAAAIVLGASAVQIGTGLLRTPEAAIAPGWSDAISKAEPEDTVLTRAFSGRMGRGILTDYLKTADNSGSPVPLPYPLQRRATAKMRAEAAQSGDFQRMASWAGQSAKLAQPTPAGQLVTELWQGSLELLGAEKTWML